MNEADNYIFRPYAPSDLNFLQNSWGSSFYMFSDIRHFIPPDVFHKYHRPIRENILNSAQATVIIACAKSDPDLILGWICVEKPSNFKGLLLHFIYIKQAFRGQGIARDLMAKSIGEIKPVIFSCLTRKAAKILHKNKEKFVDFFYEPEAIYGLNEQKGHWFESKRIS